MENWQTILAKTNSRLSQKHQCSLVSREKKTGVKNKYLLVTRVRSVTNSTLLCDGTKKKKLVLYTDYYYYDVTRECGHTHVRGSPPTTLPKHRGRGPQLPPIDNNIIGTTTSGGLMLLIHAAADTSLHRVTS